MGVEIIVVVIILVIAVQLFLLLRIFKVVQDTETRIRDNCAQVGRMFLRVNDIESKAYQNLGLLKSIYDFQRKDYEGGAFITPIPIEEDSLNWVCEYCGKMEGNPMGRWECAHCGAQRSEPVEEDDRHPYYSDGGVSVRGSYHVWSL